MMHLNYMSVFSAIVASVLANSSSSLAQVPEFPVTPSAPTAFKQQVSIAADFETLQKMAVSTLALQGYRGVYIGNGYEEVPDAHVLFPDLFVTLPDRSIVTKSKIRGYYRALFSSWLGDERAIGLLKQLRLSKQSWIAYGASTIDQEGEQTGAGQPVTRPESKSEGSDKPQPEAEVRSR
jgi:hypothetical protein